WPGQRMPSSKTSPAPSSRWPCRRPRTSSWCRREGHVMKVFSGKRRDTRGRSDGGAGRDDARSFRWRANFMLALLVCAALGLSWRAVELQLKDHKFLAGQGDARFSRVAEITATRGTITDRYGEPVAGTAPVGVG